MATALVRGFLEQGIVEQEQVLACDHSTPSQDRFIAETGASCVESLVEVVNHADFLFLAVKPQQLPEVGSEVAPLLKPQQTVISIAAGVPLAKLGVMLSDHRRLVRIMPNTPALVGCGAAGLAVGEGVDEADVAAIQALMNSVGLCERIPESLMDAVTGLSGSGPAYVFQFIEALSDGGVMAGLPRDKATKLAAQTVLGAAKMVLETGQHPGELKDAVASPAGTTIYGLAALEENAFRSAVIEAVSASANRSKELGE